VSRSRRSWQQQNAEPSLSNDLAIPELSSRIPAAPASNLGEPMLSIALPKAALEHIAEHAAQIVLTRLDRVPPGSPYLTASEAAQYLRCSRQRLYDLLSAGRLARYKDGRRVLVLRDELDAHLDSATAKKRQPVSPASADPLRN
jgi:excisionase family DNA binding protein